MMRVHACPQAARGLRHSVALGGCHSCYHSFVPLLMPVRVYPGCAAVSPVSDCHP